MGGVESPTPLITMQKPNKPTNCETQNDAFVSRAFVDGNRPLSLSAPNFSISPLALASIVKLTRTIDIVMGNPLRLSTTKLEEEDA